MQQLLAAKALKITLNNQNLTINYAHSDGL
jgi:hypothetical protein